MKKNLLAGMLLTMATALQAQPNMIRVCSNSYGEPGVEYGKCIANPVGNGVVSSGVFNGTVFFGPGGTGGITATGSSEMYLLKNDLSCGFLWVRKISGTGIEEPTNIVSEASTARVYVTGYFTGSANFDPAGSGAGAVVSAGGNDIFVACYDNSGAFVWVKRFGSTTNDEAYGLYLNNSTGELLVSGSFTGGVTFGTTTLTNYGGLDGFFLRLNKTSGAVIGAYDIGGSGDDAALGVCCDLSNNIYVTGYFSNSCDFNPAVGIVAASSKTSFGGKDIFISGYSAAGGYTWSTKAGSPSDDISNDIVFGGNSSLFITGGCGSGLAQFSGSLSWTVTGTGMDAYVASYLTSGGGATAISPCTGSDNDQGLNLAVDANGYLMVTGDYRSVPFVIDNKTGGAVYSSFANMGFDDMFILRYRTTMLFRSSDFIGGSGRDNIPGLSVEPTTHEVYTTGHFESTGVDFDPSVGGTFTHSSSGANDIFVEKFNWTTPLRLGNPDADQTAAVYPNPSSGLIQLSQLPEHTTVDVFSIDGRLIMSRDSGENGSMELDLSAVESGVYILRMNSDSGEVNTERIVIQH